MLSLWFYDWRYVRGAVVWDAVHDGLGVGLAVATGVEMAAIAVAFALVIVLLVVGRVKKYDALHEVVLKERHRHGRRHGGQRHRMDLRRGLRPESRTRV